MAAIGQPAFAVLAVACAAVFLADWLFRRVPNWLVAAIAAVWLALYVADAAGWSTGLGLDALPALACLLAAFAFLLPFWLFKAMGAGDVKFFALLGGMLGVPAVLAVWLFASVLAGLHALLQVFGVPVLDRWTPAWRELAPAKIDGRAGRAFGWLKARQGGRRGIPYAAYLAVAAVVVPPWLGS